MFTYLRLLWSPFYWLRCLCPVLLALHAIIFSFFSCCFLSSFWKFLNIIWNLLFSVLSISSLHLSGICCLPVCEISSHSVRVENPAQNSYLTLSLPCLLHHHSENDQTWNYYGFSPFGWARERNYIKTYNTEILICYRSVKYTVCKHVCEHLFIPEILQAGAVKGLNRPFHKPRCRVQGLCESRGGRPGLRSLISLRFLWTQNLGEPFLWALVVCTSTCIHVQGWCVVAGVFVLQTDLR